MSCCGEEVQVKTSNLFNIALLLLTAAACRQTVPEEAAPRDTPKLANSGVGGGGKKTESATEPPAELGSQLHPHTGPVVPSLWLQPGDLMTSTGETPIRVTLDAPDAPISTELMASIASVVQLHTFPDLAPVPVTVTTHIPQVFKTPTDNPSKNVPAPTKGTFDPSDRAFVELQPKSKLPDSWYVLSLTKVPAGVRTVPWAAPTSPIGAYGVRFHTGSRPTLSRVLFCEKGSGATKVVFEFSENVRGMEASTSSQLVSVQQPALKKACTFVESGPTPSSSRWLHLSCSDFSLAEPWEIILNPGLASPSGDALATFAGAKSVQQSLDVAKLPDSGDGCRVWRPL